MVIDMQLRMHISQKIAAVAFTEQHQPVVQQCQHTQCMCGSCLGRIPLLHLAHSWTCEPVLPVEQMGKLWQIHSAWSVALPTSSLWTCWNSGNQAVYMTEQPFTCTDGRYIGHLRSDPIYMLSANTPSADSDQHHCTGLSEAMLDRLHALASTVQSC